MVVNECEELELKIEECCSGYCMTLYCSVAIETIGNCLLLNLLKLERAIKRKGF